MDSSSKKYFFFLDFFKIFFFIPILIFHVNEVIYGTDVIPIRNQTYLYRYMAEFAEYFGWSGQGIVGLFAYLYGKRGISIFDLRKLLPLFFIGIAVVLWAYFDTSGGNSYWDIYQFLIVAYLSLFLLQVSSVRWVLGLLGFALFLLPLQSFRIHSFFDNPIWHEILWGFCREDHKTSWPLIPNIGVVWFFYFLGNLSLKFSTSHLKYLLSISAFSLFLCFPSLTVFHTIPAGQGQYCYVIDSSFMARLGIMSYMIFFFISSEYLKTPSWLPHGLIRFLSHSFWTRHFGLAYILHLLFLSLFSDLGDLMLQNPIYFDLVLLFAIPLVEILGKILTRFYKSNDV